MDKDEKADAYATAAHRASVEVSDFLEAEVVPIIHAQTATSRFEEALILLYFRLVLWGRSLALLDHPNHFQAVRSGARAAFELHLDMHHLATLPKVASQMFAFSYVWKFSSASKMVAFLKDHPEFDESNFRHHKALADNAKMKQEYESLLDQFWPSRGGKKKTPSDWFGGTVYDKARSAGPEFELEYRDEYGLASLFAHSGLVAIDSMSNEVLVIGFARGHLNFKRYYLKATEIICRELHVLEAKPGLLGRLRELEDNQQRILSQILAAKDGIDLPSI